LFTFRQAKNMPSRDNVKKNAENHGFSGFFTTFAVKTYDDNDKETLSFGCCHDANHRNISRNCNENRETEGD
jgi:hypothetical protein